MQSHTGGHATCKSKATCSKCHKEYGELSSHIPSADDGDCMTAILCSVCDKVTTEGRAAHSWNQGHVTKQPTCVAKGEKTLTCTECGKISVKETEIDENAHADSDENHICDLCEAKLPGDGLSGGAIVGIVIGSVAILCGSGFALWWFVFRKKRII